MRYITAQRHLPARRARAAVLRSLAGIAFVGAVTVGFLQARGLASFPVVAVVYLFPVGLAASLWGVGPGVATAVAALLALDVLFIPPLYQFGITRSEDAVLVLAFVLVTLVGIPMLGRAKGSLAEANARQQELTHLYELMTALAGARREDTIARAVAARLQEALQARGVEVVFQPGARRESVSHYAPEGGLPPDARPDMVVPLMTPRGLLGEVHLWLAGPRLAPPAEQWLRTAAGQAALAYERVTLAQAETRAHVLEESDRLKSVLLSSVSHELRTPLATIKAAISSLRSGEVRWDTRAREDLMAAVEEETDHLNLLVGNLLDMSRIEAGALKPQKQWNVLADVLGSALSRLRRQLAGYRIDADVSEDLPLAPVDFAGIDQVFTNLLSNSAKYAEPGSRIGVSASAAGDALVVTVANQSPPVPGEHLGRIFDKFYRVTAADRVTGTGLGLSICKGIVEAHGGRIWAENLPAGGAFTFAFHFTLPLTLDGARSPRLAAADVDVDVDVDVNVNVDVDVDIREPKEAA